ncbi:hypothetical protein CANARDRAFT_7470 [[Candida] arabinofermentans NRRL YB-2248]|uniref:Peptide chain release factor 1, mitochondrial n=1 Tax=[Candida] arabinofermentans NRRL YB-2248 TaxID=983967 RepID=A0A1E4T0W3_9ASCO|nr:hypothetical protein CANARDRAFT_7470 [[Candida] arabinofermentans NRRL YB-2248]
MLLRCLSYSGKVGVNRAGLKLFNKCLYSTSNDDSIEVLHPSLLKKTKLLQDEFKLLESQLSSGVEFKIEQSKKYTKLSKIISIYNDYLENMNNYNELKLMLNDESLKDEVIEELKLTIPNLNKLTNKLKTNLLPDHPFANKPCLIELRPGVGGNESNIFTEDLLEMYIKYCQFHNWSYEIISKTINPSSGGKGIIEATLVINELGSYNRLRFEAGVHRVQRIPETETKGRIHTSASGVIVLPKIESNTNDPNARVFKNGELRIDVMRASGSGGQHVNTTESAVRIVHLPTGITVNIQDERSQHKNKDKAMTVLRARLAELEMREKAEKDRKERTGQVSSVDRSDKIRTYNYQQNRITDHRCNFTLYDLEGCMNGEKLDEIIDKVEQKETDERSQELINEIENV